jgi:hypothetical protein
MKQEDLTSEHGTTRRLREIILVTVWGALVIWLLIRVWLPIIQ